MAKTPPEVIAESPLIEVRNSALHGLGVFATQDIKKGTRIIEYIGDRISHAEADRRYESKDDTDNHTFLFSVDSRVVIDAGEDGNDARYFNHSCDPNCESVIEQRRVFIETIKDIAAGDEMTYDYQIGREKSDPPNIDEIYACKCGANACRGTMLWPPKRPKAKAKKKVAAGKKAVAKKDAAGRSAAKTGASSKVAERKTGGTKPKVSARDTRGASLKSKAKSKRAGTPAGSGGKTSKGSGASAKRKKNVSGKSRAFFRGSKGP